MRERDGHGHPAVAAANLEEVEAFERAEGALEQAGLVQVPGHDGRAAQQLRSAIRRAGRRHGVLDGRAGRAKLVDAREARQEGE